MTEWGSAQLAFKSTGGTAGSGVGYGAAAEPRRWVLVPRYSRDDREVLKRVICASMRHEAL